MARRRSRREETPTGVVLVDKPVGPSTRDVLRVLARRHGWSSSGHCGTLDPLASGLVVVVLGAATRVQDLLMGGDKVYEARLRLGHRSETDDAEGPFEAVAPEGPAPDLADVEAALVPLRGEIEQRPPAHSAVKIDGARLYSRARRGESVEAPCRRVRVDRLEVAAYDWPRLDLTVECGPGTYVRSLARDLGEALGTGAHLTDLRRIASGGARVEEARAAEEIEAAHVLSLEEALRDHARVDLSREEVEPLLRGRPVAAAGRVVEEDALAWCEGRILGRLRRLEEGRTFRLRRLVQPFEA